MVHLRYFNLVLLSGLALGSALKARQDEYAVFDSPGSI